MAGRNKASRRGRQHEVRETDAHFIWCRMVAEMAAGTLVVANILPSEHEERAREIIAEEIYVRMVAGNLPPPGRP